MAVYQKKSITLLEVKSNQLKKLSLGYVLGIFQYDITPDLNEISLAWKWSNQYQIFLGE